jgi:2-polyprenyl-6-hydroxyphenyl methylase/3-demethylubiquinone-9 3-methyltransferase
MRWKIAQAAELKWWQNYLKNKDAKAYLEWKKSYWKDFLKTNELVVPENSVCLDAGCGPAGIFIILENSETDAIDPLIDNYSSRLSIFKKNNYPFVQFFNSSIENFESEKQYDQIFCLNAINHVSNWEKSIENLVKVLKPDGTLLLSTDVHRYKLLKPIFRLLPGDILHPQQHSIEDYRRILLKYKLEILKENLIKRTSIFDYYAFVLKIH